MPNAGAITEAGKLQADGSIAGAITPALECALSVAKGEENSGQSQAKLNVCVLPQRLLTQRGLSRCDKLGEGSFDALPPALFPLVHGPLTSLLTANRARLSHPEPPLAA